MRTERRILMMLVGVVACCAHVRSAVADCPTTVTFVGSAPATVDVGWNGLAHGLPVDDGTLPLAVTCAASTPPCAPCSVTGIATSPARPQRCLGDTSIACTPATEIADCGAAGTCRTLLGPPQTVGIGGLSLCWVASVGAGSVGGTFDPESGMLEANLPLRTDVYGGLFNATCPRCAGDPTPNDGLAGGTCDRGPRNGLACDAHAISPYSDYGTTSFDCPPPQNELAASAKSNVTASTADQTMTLSASSLDCPGLGKKCFCGTCNDPNGEPCTGHADCPPNGATPGICNGKRCLGGTNVGAACFAASECPGATSSGCGVPGDGPKPNTCLDDSSTPDPSCQDLGTGHGECVNGPVSKACTNHPNRGCSGDADCGGGIGSCRSFNRACFLDLGVIGGSESAAGEATPPVAGIADPVTLGVLGCEAATSSQFVNVVIGLPGLARSVQPGRLLLDDAAIPTPAPTPTPTLAPTPISECPASVDVCREPTLPRKAVLQMRNESLAEKDALQWTWPKGSATTIAELGMPTTSDAYDVCVYDASGLRAAFALPPAGLCNGTPCWRETPKGFSYRNKTAVPTGVTQLDLKTGANGNAQIRLKGRGPYLPLPDLATLASPLRLQLRRRATGLCWSATFGAPYTKLTATILRDRAD